MGLLSEATSRLLEFLRWYPEILLAVAFFILLRRFTTRTTRLPTNWPVIGMLPALLSNLHRIHDFATEILAESGCTFLVKGPWFSGMDLLVTVDPANINHVFNINFPNYPKGSEFLEIFDVLGDGIFNADDESWRAQRRMAHALMAEKRFRKFAGRTNRRKIQEGLLPLLNAAAAESKNDCRTVVDLHDLFLRFAFDTTCILVFGTDPGCLSAGLPAVEFADAVDTVEEVLLFRHVVPRPFWKLMRLLRVGEESRMARAWAAIDDFVYRSVTERREELCKTIEDGRRAGGEKKLASMTNEGEDNEDDAASADMMTSYLDGKGALDGKVPKCFDVRSNAFLRDTALNLMIAGRDTTAAALSWFFHLVSTHPKVEACILRELRTLHAAENSHGGPVLFEQDELASLVYLHAALLETLRLYPSVPFEHKGPIAPETLPSGHAVHPGLKVLVSMYAMGRMCGVWGEDAAEFRPGRWINERGRLRHEPSYKFLSFNSGPRTCLGKDLAMNQMKAVASALVYNYEFRPVQGHRVEPKVSIILHMKYGLKLEVRKREAWPQSNGLAVDSPSM